MKHRFEFLVVLSSGMFLMLAAPARAQDLSGFDLVNAGSGLCLQPVPEAALNGVSVLQETCDSNNPHYAYQKWSLRGVSKALGQPGIYRIINSATGLCLDDTNGSTTDATPVQLWVCNSTSTTMQWAVWSARNDGYYEIKNVRSGKMPRRSCKLRLARCGHSDLSLYEQRHRHQLGAVVLLGRRRRTPSVTLPNTEGATDTLSRRRL
jgi:hypothetical protein